MNKTIIHSYKDVQPFVLEVSGNGACEKKEVYWLNGSSTIHKNACYYPDSTNNLIQQLWEETSGYGAVYGTRLFASSKCKTNRDTFRNSGYSMTIDKTKASVIAVPNIIPNRYLRYSCNLVARNDEKEILYLVSIRKTGYEIGEDITDFEMDVARSFLENTMKLTVDTTLLTDLTVWFLPKCDELNEVMTGNMLNVPYIQESRIQTTASTTINPETLVLWENISDPNLLSRTICTSDWAHYPITILVLLAGFRSDVNWNAEGNANFKDILHQIGYIFDGYYGYGNTEDLRFEMKFLKDRDISKKDYDMLQRYVFYRFGVDENGGFITGAQWRSLPTYLRAILQRRVYVKPFSLPSKMKCQNIIDIVGK